jgi:hypothetical protein
MERAMPMAMSTAVGDCYNWHAAYWRGIWHAWHGRAELREAYMYDGRDERRYGTEQIHPLCDFGEVMDR